MAYRPNSAFIGKCAGCGDKNELHKGNDGKGYCETCLAKDRRLDPMSTPKSAPGRTSQDSGGNTDAFSNKRDTYLEYIICHVTDEWIDCFLDEWKNEMKRSYGWVNELRAIDDNMKLLRLAAELGYGKKVKYKPSLNYDAIAEAAKVDEEEKKSKSKKRKTKKGSSRAKKKKGS